jgi:hypothetical protein
MSIGFEMEVVIQYNKGSSLGVNGNQLRCLGLRMIPEGVGVDTRR